MYSIILFAEYILVNKLQDNVQHCSQCQDTCAAAARVARNVKNGNLMQKMITALKKNEKMKPGRKKTCIRNRFVN